jgi:uncharacterized protein YggE
MRKAWIGVGFVVVAVVGFGLSTGSTRAQPAAGAGADANHRKVTVSGTATVAVKPDTARVSFAVKGHGNDFKSAAADCDKKAATVLKAIDELKVAGLEIKKGPLNFTNHGGGFGPPLIGPGGPPPMPLPPMGVVPGGVAPPPPPPPPPGVDILADQPPPVAPPAVQPPAVAQPPVVQPQPVPALPPPMGGGPGEFPGMPGWGGAFEVTRTFTVVASFGKEGGAGKLEDIVTVADKLLAAAVSAGATDAPVFTTPAQSQFGGGFGPQQANRVEFYRANLAALRQEAIKLAVADALANAKVATGAANITTKEIVTITDQTQNQFGPFGMQGQAANTGRGEVQGDAELTVTLSVTFSY